MIKNKFLEFRGRPLVRKGNVIYYGYMDNEVVAMLTVESEQDKDGIKVPTLVQIQLIATDPKIPPQEMVKKHTRKDNIYDALDVADVWIKRYRPKKKV